MFWVGSFLSGDFPRRERLICFSRPPTVSIKFCTSLFSDVGLRHRRVSPSLRPSLSQSLRPSDLPDRPHSIIQCPLVRFPSTVSSYKSDLDGFEAVGSIGES